MHEPKRITIFVGYYGSGKTEIAVNYAMYLKQLGKKVVIIDFDIVNPYFRTKDAEDILTQNGIRLIAPMFANTNLENPGIPPEIYSVFADKECYVIFDVGGGEDGAIPLGRYHQYFEKEACDVFFVVNERRMITHDLEGALDAFSEIAAVTRVPITALINNTHLKEETTWEIIMEGQKLAEQLSEATGLPIAYLCGTQKPLSGVPASYDSIKFPLQTYINLIF